MKITKEELEEYLTFCKSTWNSNEHDFQKICLGMVEEFGEFLGKEKKELRGDDGEYRSLKIKELDELAYYTVMFK